MKSLPSSGSILHKILQLFNAIYLLGTELQPGYDLMIYGKFLELLWIIQTNKKSNLFTKAVIEELSLQEAADYFSVSSFYLSQQLLLYSPTEREERNQLDGSSPKRVPGKQSEIPRPLARKRRQSLLSPGLAMGY